MIKPKFLFLIVLLIFILGLYYAVYAQQCFVDGNGNCVNAQNESDCNCNGDPGTCQAVPNVGHRECACFNNQTGEQCDASNPNPPPQPPNPVPPNPDTSNPPNPSPTPYKNCYSCFTGNDCFNKPSRNLCIQCCASTCKEKCPNNQCQGLCPQN